MRDASGSGQHAWSDSIELRHGEMSPRSLDRSGVGLESKQRRSGRVRKAITILLIGSDSEGLVFSEETKTMVLAVRGGAPVEAQAGGGAGIDLAGNGNGVRSGSANGGRNRRTGWSLQVRSGIRVRGGISGKGKFRRRRSGRIGPALLEPESSGAEKWCNGLTAISSMTFAQSTEGWRGTARSARC